MPPPSTASTIPSATSPAEALARTVAPLCTAPRKVQDPAGPSKLIPTGAPMASERAVPAPPESVKDTVPSVPTLIPNPPASAVACAAQPAEPVAKLQLVATGANFGSGGGGGASGGGKGKVGLVTTGFGGAWQPAVASSSPNAKPFVSNAGEHRRRGVWSNLGMGSRMVQILRLEDFYGTMNGG